MNFFPPLKHSEMIALRDMLGCCAGTSKKEAGSPVLGLNFGGVEGVVTLDPGVHVGDGEVKRNHYQVLLWSRLEFLSLDVPVFFGRFCHQCLLNRF